MKKPIFALIPSGYKASKLYTPIPINGEADFVSTRGTVAHRMNKDGYLEEMAANVPRLDYSDSKCPILLLEPSSTNLIPYSEPNAQGQGWAVNLSPIISYNDDIAPNGTLTAERYECDGNSQGKFLVDTVPFTLGNTITVSYFLKYVSGSGKIKVNITGTAVSSTSDKNAYFDIKTGVIESLGSSTTFAEVQDYGNGWRRYIVQTVATATGQARCTYYSEGSDYNEFLIWGRQMEENAVVTSYIKTTGSSAARNIETCNGSGDLTLWNNLNKEGSWYFNIKPINDGVQLKSISIADSTLASRILLRQDDDYTYRFYLIVGGVAKATLTANLDQALEWHKIAVRWKQDNVQIFLNGIEVATDTTVDLAGALDYDEFAFDNGGGSQQWTGSVKEAMVWDEYLTDEELIELTAL